MESEARLAAVAGAMCRLAEAMNGLDGNYIKGAGHDRGRGRGVPYRTSVSFPISVLVSRSSVLRIFLWIPSPLPLPSHPNTVLVHDLGLNIFVLA
jgi:hypothetical protein